MLRFVGILVVLFGVVSGARAHFVFVAPEKEGRAARVILSESLQADDEIPVDIYGGAKLMFTDAAGRDSALSLHKEEHSYSVDLGAGGAGVVHGVADLGVVKRGETKPGWLVYYPKAVLGDPFDAKSRVGDGAVMELAAVGEAGKFKFLLLVGGKPAPEAEVDVILPDGTDKKVMTDKEGLTTAFDAAGRYGAWARHVEAVAGEKDGKKYEEIRRYATLVMDVPAAAGVAATTREAAGAANSVGAAEAASAGPATNSVGGGAVTVYAPMPQKASSFGAVACEGWLYIYGGHIVDTHSYSTASVSGEFNRLNLADHKTWEALPGGPPLQGLNLAAWHGKIYRVGGMRPRNKAGEDDDVRSVAECACFDPASKQWTALPALPEARSSHDIAVVGNQLIVVGGWDLGGDPDDAKWFDTTLTMDLSAANPQWKKVKQPFKRRAMIAASFGGKMYVIGGFETEAEPSLGVDIYDPAADAWTKGPDLPGPKLNGFGPAACALDGRLYVSVADGSLLRLNEAGSGWEKIAKTTPRIVHRMVANGSEVLVIGGAARQKQLSLIEAVDVKAAKVMPASTQPSAVK